MKSLKTLIEKYLIKIRYIYLYPQLLPTSSDVRCLSLADAEEELDDQKIIEKIKNKRNPLSWIIFVLTDNGITKGYSFLHIPDEAELFDSLMTCPDESRECGTFVFPEYRGSGIRGHILASQIQYAKNNNKKIWAVIERSNNASIRSAEKCFGKKERVNILIKFLGRNLFSITTNPFSVIFLLGKKK
jgi:RimJ/RimL family protein N-acetyltransferase